MKTVKICETDYNFLQSILENGEMTRTELYKKLKISPASITKIVKKLENMNIINIKEEENLKRTKIVLNKEYAYIIGVNIGASFIDVVIANLSGEIINTRTYKYKETNKSKVLNTVIDSLKNVFDEYKDKYIVGLGAAINGIINIQEGLSVFSPHLKWENLYIRDILKKELKIENVFIDNDVKSMFYAELFYGKYYDLKNSMLLYIKNGIGGALYLDGKIFYGSNYSSGEIGHYTVNYESQNRCKCGNYGCLEAEFSDNVILDKINWELSKLDNKKMVDNIKEVYRNANLGIEPYYTVITNTAYYLGRIIANLLKIVDIEKLIVAGELFYSGTKFFKFLEKGIKDGQVEKIGSKIEISICKLGYDIEKCAPISLVLNNLFKNEKIIKYRR